MACYGHVKTVVQEKGFIFEIWEKYENILWIDFIFSYTYEKNWVIFGINTDTVRKSLSL